ncbi:hypothetical protein Syun_022476 [Stephania yunnanensis]|uniref:Uncharacterized protein n=1 Tax=Stephania yunnanensis TaxID=152371 RepID=A0AAP0F723_9MAGN
MKHFGRQQFLEEEEEEEDSIMGEDSLTTTTTTTTSAAAHSDRRVEQVNFLRQPQPEKESQSFSIIYANGERSLDLICKDKEQAEVWMAGLGALVFRSLNQRPPVHLRSHRGAQSCVNSPVGYSRRKHNLGLLEETTKYSQVRSLCGSPPRSLVERGFSDGLSHSSDSLFSSEPRTFSNMQTTNDVMAAKLSSLQQGDLKEKKENYASVECQSNLQGGVSSPSHGFPAIQRTNNLRDVLMWGEGIEGGNLGGVDSIGPGTNTQFDALLPKLLESTALLDVENISFGGKHAALVTRQGEVFCWGKENGGRLGHKISMDVSCPKIVESLNGVHVKSVACGEYHTCAVTNSGELYTWGDWGLGANLTVNSSHRSPWLPKVLFSPLNGMHVSSVACGEWHTAIVSSSGQLFTFGDGTFGVLGHDNLQSFPQPKEVESLKGLRVKTVACGPWHTAAVVDIMVDHYKVNTSSGKLFTWGDGDKGRLGHLDLERKLLPTCVARLIDHDFVQVSCGRMLTVGLTDKGAICTMGSAVHGQLGNPYAEDKSITIVEGNLKGDTVKNISSGSYHVAALTSTGRVYTWGKGANGRLGLGDVEDRNTPTLVEALRERQVETIVCGSSFTAAICLHKSVFSADQSTCTGCKIVFGFTRKKRNCYNCGFLFCRACSSKKAWSASLAPNKCKPYHFVNSNRVTQHENSEQSFITWKPLSDLRTDREEATTTQGLLLSPKLSNHEDAKFIGGQSLSKDGRNPQLVEDELPSFGRQPRWGVVRCPLMFSPSTEEDSQVSKCLIRDELSSAPPLSASQILSITKFNAATPVHTSGGLSVSDKILTDEVQRLQAEAKSLEKQCRMRSEKLQQYQQKIEETRSLAREEAAKSKAAKEIIKALTMQLYSLSEKLSNGKDANAISLPFEGLDMDSLSMQNVDHLLLTSAFKDSQVNDVCSSPTLFHDSASTAYERDYHGNGSARLATDLPLVTVDSRQNGSRTSKLEWVEQDEPGVYITFATLPSGQRGLKRVRFSRKRFSEKEAERWWEENQQRVYEKYEIEGFIK